MPNPNTPRSTSVTNSKLCLLDIKTLIETSKIEILNTVKNEHAKLNDVIATLLTKIDGLETKNAQLEQRCKKLEQVNTELVNGRDAQITPAEENLAFIYSECEERRLKESNLIFLESRRKLTVALKSGVQGMKRRSTAFSHIWD